MLNKLLENPNVLEILSLLCERNMTLPEIISVKKEIEGQKILAFLGELSYYGIISVEKEQGKKKKDNDSQNPNSPLLGENFTPMSILEINSPFFGLSAMEFTTIWEEVNKDSDKVEFLTSNQINFSLSHEIKAKLKNCDVKEIKEIFTLSA